MHGNLLKEQFEPKLAQTVFPIDQGDLGLSLHGMCCTHLLCSPSPVHPPGCSLEKLLMHIEKAASTRAHSDCWEPPAFQETCWQGKLQGPDGLYPQAGLRRS
ncbi:hypothetical protein WJX84_004912 [Apatococcus fuscideae]|uniref:Uncharacterized protein n=1 Tax=Apatococcus fuscideae TaxID=2026836 RepID=A0AAW1SUG0_9CHLO